MDSTEKLIGEILFAWLHVICTPLLFLGPLHPGTPGHPLNPLGTSLYGLWCSDWRIPGEAVMVSSNCGSLCKALPCTNVACCRNTTCSLADCRTSEVASQGARTRPGSRNRLWRRRSPS